MKEKNTSTYLLTGLGLCSPSLGSGLWADTPENYTNNRYPLVRRPFMELPLGSTKVRGWLREMLVRQKNGATGQMDKLYPLVMGECNGWLGNDGDQWERGPYRIDGLLPPAYLPDDAQPKAKVQPRIEQALNNQREDGFFGPAKDYPGEASTQQGNPRDR